MAYTVDDNKLTPADTQPVAGAAAELRRAKERLEAVEGSNLQTQIDTLSAYVDSQDLTLQTQITDNLTQHNTDITTLTNLHNTDKTALYSYIDSEVLSLTTYVDTEVANVASANLATLQSQYTTFTNSINGSYTTFTTDINSQFAAHQTTILGIHDAFVIEMNDNYTDFVAQYNVDFNNFSVYWEDKYNLLRDYVEYISVSGTSVPAATLVEMQDGLLDVPVLVTPYKVHEAVKSRMTKGVPSAQIGSVDLEQNSILVDGVSYTSALKVTDVGGENLAETLIHRHSTLYPAVLATARAKSDTTAHADVAAGDTLFSLVSTGWYTNTYRQFTSITAAVDTIGTLGATSAPGRLLFNVTPNGSVIPEQKMELNSNGRVKLAASGTEALPNITFANTINSGMYFTATTYGLSLAGSKLYEYAAGTHTFIGAINVTDSIIVGGDITATGSATIGGNIDVTDSITLGGNITNVVDITAVGNTTLNTLYTTGYIDTDSTLDARGKATLVDTDMLGDAYISGDLRVDEGFVLSQLSGFFSSGLIYNTYIIDTNKDSDPEWINRTEHLSYAKEARPSGIYLGKYVDETAARAAGGVANDWYTKSGNTTFFQLVGASGETEIFRAGSAKFPKFAVAVAEDARVIIFDITKPEPEMWMVFTLNASATFTFLGYGDHTISITAIAYKEGVLVVSGTDGVNGRNLGRINFHSDSGILYGSANHYAIHGGIANRNNHPLNYSVLGNSNVVHYNTNYVAITVLDTAPVNSSGLKEPTIVANTAGGVSVVTHDGEVYDSVTTTNGNRCFIDGSTLYYDSASSAPLYVLELGSINADGFSGEGYSAGTSPVLNIPSADVQAIAKDAVGSNSKVVLLARSGMTADITNTYNTSWMLGDIRRAYLADSVVGSLTSPDTGLVTNGTFDVSTSGWTIGNGATAFVDSQRLRLTNGTGTNDFGFLYQAVNGLTVGRHYIVTVDYTAGTASGAYLRVGEDSSTTTGTSLNITGKHGYSFVATNSTMVIKLQIASNVDSVYAFFDNVILREALVDRSVKAKGAEVVGTLNRTLIHPDSDIVAVSGFSAANYILEPYSADLDTNTPAVSWWFKQNANTTDEIHWMRAYHTGAAWSGAGSYARTNPAGNLVVSLTDDGFVTSDVITSGSTYDDGQWHNAEFYVTSTNFYLYVDGVLVGSQTRTSAAGSLANANATLMIGYRQDNNFPMTNGSLALMRFSATAPTEDQIKFAYETERRLFQGGKGLLDGTSNNVNTISYDPVKKLTKIGTNWGSNIFNNLERVSSAVTTVGIPIAYSDMGGIKVESGLSGVNISIDEINAREKLLELLT